MPNQSPKRKTLFSLQNYGSSTGYAVSANNIGITGTNPCSMIQWVMPQRLIAAFQVSMTIGTPGGAAGTSYILGIDSSNKYIARLGGTISAQGPVAQVGVPVPLILTSNGSRLRLYIGQTFIAEVAITPNIANTPLLVGTDLTSGTPSPFFGLISDPIVCNAELTQAEIIEYATTGIVPASAILHYQMGLDGGAGTAVTDSIGTNHATITGMSWNTWSPYNERKRVIPRKSALRLDGSSGYIPMGTHASYAIGNAGWIKARFLLDKNQIDTSSANNRFLMTIGDGTLNNFITLIVRNSAPYELVTDCRAGGVSRSLASVGANTTGLLDGVEHEGLLTWDGTSAELFLDGKRVAVRVEDMRVSGLATGTPDMVAGRVNSGVNARYATGELSGLAYGNAKVTAQEVYDNHYFGKPIASQVGAWECNDVGGPTVNVAGTGNAATIAGTTTWVKRAGARAIANQNMVYNGDFEIRPPFVAAQTATNFINGTAAGSSAVGVGGWWARNRTASMSAQFDTSVFHSGTGSIKGSTLDALGTFQISNFNTVSPTLAQIKAGGIRVQPNTTYKLEVWAKTSNAATNAVYAAVTTYKEDGTGGAISSSATNLLSGTNDWTLLTKIFTTGVNDVWLQINLNNIVAGNISDVWFDDVTLLPSVPTRKLPVNGSLAFNGNFEDVPPVLTAGTNTAGRWIDGTAAGSTTRRDWGWSIPTGAISASAEATYDPAVSHSGQASLRLSTLNGSGIVAVANALNSSAPIPATDRIFPLLPNTQYQLTAWIKTSNVASNGAYVDIRETNASLVTVTTTSSTKLSGTNDWTQVTINFTTSATTYWGMILLRNFVAGNVSDAWFDDISIKAVGGAAMRPSPTKPFFLSYNGTNQTGTTPSMAFAGATQLTFLGWLQVPFNQNGSILMESSANVNLNNAFSLGFNFPSTNDFRMTMYWGCRDNTLGRSSTVRSSPLIPGRLYRVLLTIDQSIASAQAKIYTDGVLNVGGGYAADQQCVNGIASNIVYFGARAAASVFARANFMLEKVIIGKAFSAAEVLSEFVTGVTPSGGTVLATYPTTEGDGPTIADTSGNAYNITLANKPLWVQLPINKNRLPT